MAPARIMMLLIAFYLAWLADSVCGPRLAIGRACPDWTALVLLLWLLRTRSDWAPLLAGGLGLLTDLSVGGRVGPGVAAFAVAAYIVPRIASKLPSRSVPVEALAIAVGTFGVVLVLAIAAYIANELPDGPGATLVYVGGTAAYTGLTAVPFLMLQNWLGASSMRASWRYGG